MIPHLRTDRLVTLTGTAEQRAFEQGRIFASVMPAAASSICSLLVDPRKTGKRLHTQLSQVALLGAGAYYRRRLRPALEFYRRGKYLRVQRQLGRGARTPIDLMYGLSAFPEIVASKIGYTMGCTTVALAPEATESGAAQILYNHDFPARFGRFLYLRRTRPTDALAAIELVYPLGVGGVAGVNEAGLAVALNAAFATDFTGKPGLQPSFIVTDCLEHCETVDQALEVCLNTPYTNGSMITLADKSGARAVVEISCTQVRQRRPDGPVLVTFNKYKHPDMDAYEVPLHAIATGAIKGLWLHETNIERQKRFDELMAARPARFGEAHIQRLMSDHRDGVGSNNTLCRHYDMGTTLATLILDTQRCAMKISFGLACRAKYREYGVDADLEQRSVA